MLTFYCALHLLQLHNKELDGANTLANKHQAQAEKALQEKRDILQTLEHTKQTLQQQLKARKEEVPCSPLVLPHEIPNINNLCK